MKFRLCVQNDINIVYLLTSMFYHTKLQVTIYYERYLTKTTETAHVQTWKISMQRI